MFYIENGSQILLMTHANMKSLLLACAVRFGVMKSNAVEADIINTYFGTK